MTNELLAKLNDQMNFEIESAHVYLGMAGYCADLGLEGFENWFLVQYEEELFHAKKLYKYINDKGQRVNVTGFESPKNEYGSLLEAFEAALEHEKKVTANFYDIMDLAVAQKEYATISYIQWFIDEQVEEEDNVSSIISKIKLVKDSGLYLLDKDISARTFNEPTE